LEIRFHNHQVAFLVVKTIKCKRGISPKTKHDIDDFVCCAVEPNTTLSAPLQKTLSKGLSQKVVRTQEGCLVRTRGVL